jgi:predicted RNA-binding protein with PIN domain
MPYLVDGNNLIGLVRRVARPTEEDRQALVAELADRLRATKARAIVFFDGPAGDRGSSLGGLSVRRPTGGSADDAIVAEVARARAPGEFIVVTSDRELGRRVREAGGKVCPPDVFFARFGRGGPTRGRDAGAEAVDVEAWLEYFGDERNRDGG